MAGAEPYSAYAQGQLLLLGSNPTSGEIQKFLTNSNLI